MRSQRKRRKIFHNDIIINVTLSETPHMNDRVYLLETASVVFKKKTFVCIIKSVNPNNAAVSINYGYLLIVCQLKNTTFYYYQEKCADTKGVNQKQ